MTVFEWMLINVEVEVELGLKKWSTCYIEILYGSTPSNQIYPHSWFLTRFKQVYQTERGGINLLNSGGRQFGAGPVGQGSPPSDIDTYKVCILECRSQAMKIYRIQDSQNAYTTFYNANNGSAAEMSLWAVQGFLGRKQGKKIYYTNETWVNKRQTVKKSKKTGDYHEEINAVVYEN
ncbi:hypothetical protein NQ317_010991 [Molorchus minor]|uniref:Uncharacterized protein n=1 Tax=Molorchus minor TaxID=1323400 RepID=A0ABQ9K1N8_9CUCU|nr:hypothetical protein NQ317_010991 [Molorchus minor]